MSYRIFLVVIISVLIASCKQKDKRVVEKKLHENWQFKAVKDTVWKKATVPGDVFVDLRDQNEIPDPFKQSHELDVQWVSDEFWEYKTKFTLSEEELNQENIQLNFSKIDTYADIFINDTFVLHTNNGFRNWKVNIKPFVRLENEIRIVFQPTKVHEEREMKMLSYELPEGERIFTRKAQFQYGWDWGPILNSFSIGDVSINLWNDLYLDDVYIKQEKVEDSLASFSARVKFDSKLIEELIFDIYVNDTLSTSRIYEKAQGEQNLKVDFGIKNPKLWWTHDLGEPYLYDIRIELRDKRNLYASKAIKKGVRTIELVTEKDDKGETFYFKLNGRPVFMKGANYIPQHSFQSQVNSEHYNNLLTDVVEANMNMLRVWGGGIYEEDIFYDICDKKGILIWQDFMFACAMYPGDQEFLNNVAVEAEEQVIRLRNHASIALWCGNNESAEGWDRWGWQMNRSEEEKQEIWSHYESLFQKLLPEIVANYTDTDYWESSPRYGRGNPQYQFEGDAHDWWVWHDARPFEHFESAVPRFMSEFGFQAYPSFEAIRYFTESDSVTIDHSSFKTHQKHVRGFSLINEYMERDYMVPETSEAYVYVSQLVQARGIAMGIEAHRRAMPYCMGSLYWQLNDCWPVISWSSIDGLGNWKALHYKAKESFQPQLISNRIVNDSIQTYLIADGDQVQFDNVKLKVLNFKGELIKQMELKDHVLSNESKHISTVAIQELTDDPAKTFLLVASDQTSRAFYFVKPKELDLTNEIPQILINQIKSGYEITISSDTLLKDVFLHTNIKGHFTQNYFDVFPNQRIKLRFITKEVLNYEGLKIKSLNSINDHYLTK